jgi:hypothetical protein
MRSDSNINATWREKFPEGKDGPGSCGRCSPMSSVDALRSTRNDAGARAFEMPRATKGNAWHFETRARVVDSGTMQNLDALIERMDVSQACDALLHAKGASGRVGSGDVNAGREDAFRAARKAWCATRKARTCGALRPPGTRKSRIAAVFRARLESPFRRHPEPFLDDPQKRAGQEPGRVLRAMRDRQAIPRDGRTDQHRSTPRPGPNCSKRWRKLLAGKGFSVATLNLDHLVKLSKGVAL